MKTIKVVAIATGFDNLVVRNEGDVFEVSESAAKKYSSWFKPVDPKFVVAPKVEPKTPADELSDLKAQVAALTAALVGQGKDTKQAANHDSNELV